MLIKRSLSSSNLHLFPFLLGFLTPILPCFGTSLLIFFATFVVLIFTPKLFFTKQNPLIQAASLFLFLLIFWATAKFFAEFDLESYQALYKYNQHNQKGIINFISLALANLSSLTQKFWITFKFIVLLALVAMFATKREVANCFRVGLLVGIVVALISVTLQVLGVVSYESFPNYSSFWHWQKRYAGTFSDPNGFGIAAVLFIPIILAQLSVLPSITKFHTVKKILLCILLVSSVTLAGYSGSRSFLLGVILETALLAFIFRNTLKERLLQSQQKTLIITAIVLTISAICFLLTQTALYERVMQSFSNGGFSSGQFYESLYSRVIFWKVGFWIWCDNFWLGSGLDSFRSLVTPYLLSKGVDLNLWSDNSNNFYLGILAELGLVGGVAFIYFLFKWREQLKSCSKGTQLNNEIEHKLSKVTVITFLILLIVGPHLEFDEVLILVAYHLAAFYPTAATTQEANHHQNGKQLKFIIVAILLLGGSIFYKAFSLQETGFYNWQKDSLGVYRWSQPKASLKIDCNDTKLCDLTTKTCNLLLKSPREQSVVIKTPFEDQKIINFSGTKPQKVPITCSGESVIIKINAPKVFIPALMKGGKDKRILGIQVYTSSG